MASDADPDSALWWLRRDLRLHDNPALVAASGADHLLPVFVFDPDHYGTAAYGGPNSVTYEKTGGRRTRFRIESVADLRSRLRDRGSGLVVRTGDPASVLSTLADRVDADPTDDRSALTFDGGETAALDRLDEYLWEIDSLREYKQTRNGLLGRDYSSKFSPWLNEGCLSPRRVHAAIDEYEDRRVENDSTYWLRFELRWRDFFQFQFAKHGATGFTPGGIRRREIAWQNDDAAFERWTRGETGIPFVDAGMRELNATGYLSNRARQNVASFLANDLRIDWRTGAAYFETRLIDYDPASNYGNWAYVAGVGNDSRNRSFDVVWQAHRYDPDAEYVQRWVPELDGLSSDAAHEPWTLPDEKRARLEYPAPMVDPATQYGD